MISSDLDVPAQKYLRSQLSPKQWQQLFSESAILISADMQSALHAPVPSSTLLKFLKSQSENICFFSPNPRPSFTFNHAISRYPALRSQILKESSKSTARCLSTTSVRRATIEAGFVDIDFLWPRAASKSLPPKSPQCRSTPRVKRSSYENSLPAHRAASTGWHNWREKVWARKKKGPVLQPDDLPESSYRDDGGDSMFSLGRHVSAKAAAQLSKVRCTELDENGNVVLASGEFKKTELIAKVHFPGYIFKFSSNEMTVRLATSRSSKD